MRNTLWIALAAASLGLSACMPAAPAPEMPAMPATDAMAAEMEAPAVAPIVCNNGVCAPAN